MKSCVGILISNQESNQILSNFLAPLPQALFSLSQAGYKRRGEKVRRRDRHLGEGGDPLGVLIGGKGGEGLEKNLTPSGNSIVTSQQPASHRVLLPAAFYPEGQPGGNTNTNTVPEGGSSSTELSSGRRRGRAREAPKWDARAEQHQRSTNSSKSIV